MADRERVRNHADAERPPHVLRDPLRYMLRHSKALLCHPAAIPAKMRDYALYDLIHLYNEVMDNVQIGRALLERGLSLGLVRPHVSFA